MDQAYTFRASKPFMRALNKSKWILQMDMSDIIREAVHEYLKKHLPKDETEIRKMLDELPEKKRAEYLKSL